MGNKKKLIIFIIIGLLIVIIAGWAFFLFKKQAPQKPSSISFPVVQLTPTPSPTATTTATLFELISEKWILSPKINKNAIWGFDVEERVFKSLLLVLKNTQEKKLSETVFEKVKDISWSPNKDMALIRFQDEAVGQTMFALFDLRQNLTYSLDGFIQEAAWSPDGTKLVVYKELPHESKFYLATISPEGTNEKKLVDIRISNIKLFWPAQDYILFHQKPTQFRVTEKIFLYDLKNKILSELIIPLYQLNIAQGINGLNLLPAPDGKRIFVSYTDEKNRSVFSTLFDKERKINVAQEEIPSMALINLPFNTLATKCVWAKDSESLYCSYPAAGFQQTAFNLPFDYWMGKVTTNDSFAKFNWKTGELKVYAENTAFDAINLDVADNESFLIFTNRKDLNLYRMKL